MINIGLVSFGFDDKKECKRMSKRLKRVTRRFQSPTHPIEFTHIEAANCNVKTDSQCDKWSSKMQEQDGYVFLLSKDTEKSKDDIENALNIVAEQVKNKTALIVYYGIDNKFGENLEAVNLLRSLDMVVLYETVTLPNMEGGRTSEVEKFDVIEKETRSRMVKLLYWTMGMKYTRSLYAQTRS